MRCKRVSALVALAALAFGPAPAAASPYTSPADIDRAVMGFTGAMPGTPGGARLPADPRLRLAACAAPLLLDWHTPARTSVRVECTGPAPWRIFVAVAPLASASAAAPAVKRGDNVMIAVRGRGFQVQQPGEAVEGGAVGDWIFVRTARKAEALRARIERPGLVVIPAR
ncbi:MAG: flagella basal body P-ring formation protein FlgA [Erythrobacter sp.]